MGKYLTLLRVENVESASRYTLRVASQSSAEWDLGEALRRLKAALVRVEAMAEALVEPNTRARIADVLAKSGASIDAAFVAMDMGALLAALAWLEREAAGPGGHVGGPR